MFDWYKFVAICYAYLEDVDRATDPTSIADNGIAKSRWFTRGWTLQELIAPKYVMFYDRNWSFIESRGALKSLLKQITGLPEELLTNEHAIPAEFFSIASRMSWASGRATTRPEDRSYSLLGLFRVNMPLLYGEGGINAFRRLQEEILKVSKDLSIFAWSGGIPTHDGRGDLLALSPDDFKTCRNLISASSQRASVVVGESRLSNVALQVNAQILRMEGPFPESGYTYMILPCRSRNDLTKVLGLRLETGAMHEFVENGMDQKKEIYVCNSEHSFERTEFIDAYTALSESKEQSITILRYAEGLSGAPGGLLNRLSRSLDIKYLWLRSLRPSHARALGVLSVYPVEHWNVKNLTFDLTDADGKDRSLSGGPIYGAAILESPRVCVMFRCALLHNRDESFIYSLARHSEWQLAARSEVPTVILHSLKLDSSTTVTLQLHVSDVFEHNVAILNIDVVEGLIQA